MITTTDSRTDDMSSIDYDALVFDNDAMLYKNLRVCAIVLHVDCILSQDHRVGFAVFRSSCSQVGVFDDVELSVNG